jgi:hypothetical protein
MQADDNQSDYMAYQIAWLGWCLVTSMLAVLLASLLYIINMFAELIPVRLAYNGFAIGLIIFEVGLIGIAIVGLARRRSGQSAWEPWPLPTLAGIIQSFTSGSKPKD